MAIVPCRWPSEQMLFHMKVRQPVPERAGAIPGEASLSSSQGSVKSSVAPSIRQAVWTKKRGGESALYPGCLAGKGVSKNNTEAPWLTNARKAMSRNERILLPGHAHHLVRMSKRNRQLFHDVDDYEYGINQIRSVAQTYGVALHGYCVLPDRFHLLVSAGDNPEALCTCMKALSCRISLYLKRRYETRSPWQPHFRSSPVESRWMLSTMTYIERLPVLNELVRTAYHYPHSSYLMRLGKRDSYWLTDPGEYNSLGNTVKERASAFRVYMKAGLEKKEVKVIGTAVMRGKLTGSEEFVREVRERYGIDGENRGPGRPRKKKAGDL